MKSFAFFLSSTLPFSESKGAILMGAALEVKWYISWLASCIGSYCVVPVILFMKRQHSELQEHWSNKEKRTHTKLIGYIRKYGSWGLFLLNFNTVYGNWMLGRRTDSETSSSG